MKYVLLFKIYILRNIDKKGDQLVTKNEVVTMNFYFSTNMELTIEERLINPLGFQVSNYQIAEEIFNY